MAVIGSGEATQWLFLHVRRTLAGDRSERCSCGALLIQRDGCRSDERLTATAAATAGMHGVIVGSAAAASGDDAAAAKTRVLRCC